MTTDEHKWHGYANSAEPDFAIHIGPLPQRKSIALSLVDGTTITPLGYFNDKKSAIVAQDALDTIFKPWLKDEGDDDER